MRGACAGRYVAPLPANVLCRRIATRSQAGGGLDPPMLIYLLSRGPFLYSTQSLQLAGKRAGHRVEVLDPNNINAIVTDDGVRLSYEGEALETAQVVLGRFSPTFTPLGAALLSQFAATGAHVSPEPAALLLARNKWRAQTALQQAGIAMPKAAMINDMAGLEDSIASLGGHPVIIKLLESTHGAGVLISHDVRTTRSILEAFSGINKGALVQEYIAESGGRDLRVIVCGQEIVACMQRNPAEGEFRSNLHRGGDAERVQLSPEERDTALRAARAVGLEIAGVDMLRSRRGPLVMEVNASPGLEGIEGTTQVDVAGAMLRQLTARFT